MLFLQCRPGFECDDPSAVSAVSRCLAPCLAVVGVKCFRVIPADIFEARIALDRLVD
jgi:hypothetical protein